MFCYCIGTVDLCLWLLQNPLSYLIHFWEVTLCGINGSSILEIVLSLTDGMMPQSSPFENPINWMVFQRLPPEKTDSYDHVVALKERFKLASKCEL